MGLKDPLEEKKPWKPVAEWCNKYENRNSKLIVVMIFAITAYFICFKFALENSDVSTSSNLLISLFFIGAAAITVILACLISTITKKEYQDLQSRIVKIIKEADTDGHEH